MAEQVKSNDFSHLRGAISSWLDDVIPQDEFQVSDAARYSLLAGGKRIRAILALLVTKAVGAPLEDSRAFACALECLHAASLVHDDLPALDNDDTRRGKPTCHKQFDEATAILAGDLLFARAFELVASDERSEPRRRTQQISQLSRAFSSLCKGQDLDLRSGREQGCTLSQIETRHFLKTGALIQASLVGPLYLMDEASTEALKPAFEAFGAGLGVLFQVTDDILDVTATEEALGKDIASDTEQDTETFVSLLGLDGAREYASSLEQKLLDDLERIELDTSELLEVTRYIRMRDR